MPKYKHPLSSAKIATPCSADWEDMIGNDRRRFCGQCELNVYNLSEMTKREAEGLINQTEGRLCVRFYRRTDGTILTRDCPVGLQAMKRRLSRTARAIVSTVLGFLSGLGLYGALHEPERQTVMGVMAREAHVGGNEFPIVENNVPNTNSAMRRSQGELGGLAAEPIKEERSRNTRLRSRR